MKLRIKGNSLRMRLSQTEIDEFSASSKVNDSICFGEISLFYELRKGDVYSAVFCDQKIVVEVPNQVATEWASTDLVGIEKTITVGDDRDLSIIIEKDFKCLTDRPNEDESDLFENPLNKHNC
jgi:hypothetical protein